MAIWIKRKPSTMRSIEQHEKIQRIGKVLSIIFMVLIAVLLIINIYSNTIDEQSSGIDYEKLNYEQSVYDGQIDKFEKACKSYELQCESFKHSVYIVETASSLYYNNKAIHEMYENIEVLKKDADTINSNFEILKDSFITINGEENKKYPHLSNTLKTENIKEIEKLTVSLKDLTATVDNSIVNVDFFNGYMEVADQRKEIVLIADAMLGKIVYEWGGKPVNTGWNDRWDEEGRGLDCSGFVQWVYWTALQEYDKDLVSTYSIANNKREIRYNELQPGDIGMKYEDGSGYLDANGNIHQTKEEAQEKNKEMGIDEEPKQITNHVGIYAGKNEYGEAVWIHCSGDAATVVKDTFYEFTCFYRIL